MRTVDCAVFFRSGQRASLRTGARTATHGDAGSARPHGARAAADQWSRQGRVSAGTRMRMTAPDLYREARRNAPRRRAVVGTRRRVRLPSRVSVVDTEIGAPRLTGCTVIMCTIGSWVRRGHLLTAMAERPFYFFKIPASVGCPDLLG